MGEIKKGSIVSIYHKTKRLIHTVGIVDKVEGNKLMCSFSITSINGVDYQHTKSIMIHHTYISKKHAYLCNSDEFDIIIDTDLIPRSYIINVER